MDGCPIQMINLTYCNFTKVVEKMRNYSKRSNIILAIHVDRVKAETKYETADSSGSSWLQISQLFHVLNTTKDRIIKNRL